jgi:hypothetical protein
LLGSEGSLATAGRFYFRGLRITKQRIKRIHSNNEEILETVITAINGADSSANIESPLELEEYLNTCYLSEENGDKQLNKQKISQFKQSSGELNTITKTLVYLLSDLLKKSQ